MMRIKDLRGQMEWSDVRVFLEIARLGTLGAAAKSLKLSHPTIGRRLRTFELSTGQVLFQRTADGLVLTEEGQLALSAAEQMEEAALRLERLTTGPVSGTLRVTSPDWFGAWVLPPVIKEFSRDYPYVDTELLTGTRLFSLARREADIAFRIEEFTEADVIQRRLIKMPHAVYVANDQPEPVIGNGSGHSLIIMDNSLGAFADIDWLRSLFPKATVRLRSNNRNVQAQMCSAGIGLAVLPTPVGDKQANLRKVDVGQMPPGRDIWMGYHRDLKAVGRLRAFVDIAVRQLA